jgi:ATP-dependent 26S proteasome regulatory subunit
VLFIEDADMCITQSARSSNPGGLSDILNLGDGLFGELADIRILVTSNADKMNLDPAIVRPGRMCHHVAVDRLTRDEARATFLSITGEEAPADLWKASDKISLAEVYRRARDKGWVPDAADRASTRTRGESELDRILNSGQYI